MTQDLVNKIGELHAKAEELKKVKEALEAEVDALDTKIKEVEAEATEKKATLLAEVKADPDFKDNTFDKVCGDFNVTYFRKVNIGYKNEADVLNYLKSAGHTNLITVKESLNKNEIKKALKADAELKAALDGFTVENISEYCTVTTAENHGKMLEHIKESTKTAKVTE